MTKVLGEEPRILFVVDKKALPEKTRELAAMVRAAQTRLLVRPDMTAARLAPYLECGTPKLVKRAQGPDQFDRLGCAVRAAGLPMAELPGIMAVGPSLRSELPAELDALQLLTRPAPPIESDDLDGDEPADVFLVRGDLTMSMGKMMAQLGHACWSLCASSSGPVLPVLVLRVDDETGLREAARRMGAEVVVDQGRTELSGPTATVAAVRAASPRHLLGLFNLDGRRAQH